MNKYPAVNGVMKNVVFSAEPGAFVDSLDGLARVLEATKPFPLSRWDRRAIFNLGDDPKTFPSSKNKKDE